jgi:hypothetical protein
LKLDLKDIEIIKSWLSDASSAGHWGDNIVFSPSEDGVLNKLSDTVSLDFSFTEEEIEQIIFDASKCLSGKFSSFNPVASVFELVTLYKLNEVTGNADLFLNEWKLSKKDIKNWIAEYY